MHPITGVPLATFRLGLWRLGRASFILRVRGAPVVAVDPVLKPVPGVHTEGRPTGDAPPFPASEFATAPPARHLPPARADSHTARPGTHLVSGQRGEEP